MKRLLLFILNFILTLSLCHAQIWQEPQLATTDFVTNQECYLYNVGSGKFYNEGNSWGTQGSVKDTGLKCKFISDGTSLKLTNYSLSKGGWRTTYITTNGAIYVDGDNPTECYWKMVPGENKTFKLIPSSPNSTYNQENYPGAMLGLDLFEDYTRTALSSILMDSEEPGTGIYLTDWAIASLSSYNQYQSELEKYKCAMTLKKLLDEAKAKGKDVSEEEAIYSNTSSTLSELNGAIDSVTSKLIEDYVAGASKDTPVDVTHLFITNPSYSNNDNEGWSGSEPSIDKLNDLQNAEFFNTNFDCYQDLRNLPSGYYSLSVQGFYRAGLEGPALEAKQGGNESSVMNVELYGTTNNKTSTIKLQSIFTGASTKSLGVDGEIHLGEWWVPNNMSSSAAYFSSGFYNGNSVIIQVSNGKLRIGLRKSTTIRRDWVMIDNWKLLYYGEEEPTE